MIAINLSSAWRKLPRRFAGCLIAALLVVSLAQPARAAKLEVVFKDGMWGLAIGALIGLAQIASYKNPDNEWYRIPTDAAYGAVLGVAFGFVEISGAFASYDRERNQLAIGIPSVELSRNELGSKVMTSLLHARF